MPATLKAESAACKNHQQNLLITCWECRDRTAANHSFAYSISVKQTKQSAGKPLGHETCACQQLKTQLSKQQGDLA
jgi:hypothetical protein